MPRGRGAVLMLTGHARWDLRMVHPRPGHNVSPLQHQPSETLVHGNTKEGTKIKTAKKHLWVNDQTLSNG